MCLHKSNAPASASCLQHIHITFMILYSCPILTSFPPKDFDNFLQSFNLSTNDGGRAYNNDDVTPGQANYLNALGVLPDAIAGNLHLIFPNDVIIQSFSHLIMQTSAKKRPQNSLKNYNQNSKHLKTNIMAKNGLPVNKR